MVPRWKSTIFFVAATLTLTLFAAIAWAVAAPAVITPPAVTGATTAGATLQATDGTWSGSTPMTFAHQWQRCLWADGASAAASLTVGREHASQVKLQDGTILIAGGYAAGVTASAEIYDPAANTMTTVGSMTVARQYAVAVLLNTGKVLIVGGNDDTAALSSADLYNPVTRTFSATTGSMTSARSDAVGALLPDGRVLVAGGNPLYGTPLSSTEIYDPVTATFSAGPSMSSARAQAQIATLVDGRVLIAGGISSAGAAPVNSSQTYVPAAGIGSFSTAVPMTNGRINTVAVKLGNGKVLVAGGRARNGSWATYDTAELYDPTANTWALTGSLPTPRYELAGTALADGSALIVGGNDAGTTLQDALQYDPTSGTFDVAYTLPNPIRRTTATLLDSGIVFYAGGLSGNLEMDSSAVLAAPPWNQCSDIAGATGSTYVATRADLARTLRSKVTASNGSATTTASDVTPAAISAAPPVGTWTPLTGLSAGSVSAVAVRGTDVYVGGSFTTASGAGTVNGIAHYDLTTGTWSALGTGVDSVSNSNRVNALAVDSQGHVWAGGSFAHIGSASGPARLARWNGSAWVAAPGAGASLGASVVGLAASGNRIYVADGDVTHGYAAIIDTVAASWTSMGSGLNAAPEAVAVDPVTGDAWYGGGFTSAGGVSNTANVARWDASASAWTSPSPGINPPYGPYVAAYNDSAYVGERLGSSVLTSTGGAWSAAGTDPFGGAAPKALAFLGDVLIVGGSTSGLVESWDGMWNTVGYGLTGSGASVLAATSRTLVAGGVINGVCTSAGCGTSTSATGVAVFRLPATAPGAPTTVVAAAGESQATVTWSAPVDDGGTAITGYTVTAAPGGAACATAGALTCVVTGLTPGTSYTFTVTATNVAGTSTASVASNAVTPTSATSGGGTASGGTAGGGTSSGSSTGGKVPAGARPVPPVPQTIVVDESGSTASIMVTCALPGGAPVARCAVRVNGEGGRYGSASAHVTGAEKRIHVRVMLTARARQQLALHGHVRVAVTVVIVGKNGAVSRRTVHTVLRRVTGPTENVTG
jgi:hypothetical protein